MDHTFENPLYEYDSQPPPKVVPRPLSSLFDVSEAGDIQSEDATAFCTIEKLAVRPHSDLTSNRIGHDLKRSLDDLDRRASSPPDSGRTFNDDL